MFSTRTDCRGGGGGNRRYGNCEGRLAGAGPLSGDSERPRAQGDLSVVTAEGAGSGVLAAHCVCCLVGIGAPAVQNPFRVGS